LDAERNLAAGRDVVAIGVAGGVVKIGALARAGAVLVVAVNEAVAVVVEAVIAIFNSRLRKEEKRGKKKKTYDIRFTMYDRLCFIQE
jgi:hypothetical protein